MADVVVPPRQGVINSDVHSGIFARDGVGDRLLKARWTNTTARRFLNEVTVHGEMLDGSAQLPRPSLPSYYVRIAANAPPAAASSIDSPINLLAEAYYDRVQSQLTELRELSGTEDEVVERGAVDTALDVLGTLHQHHLAPPEITHHGGDAVVMLWVLGTSTYAITVTEGEVGWVIRRDQRQIASRDSVSVESFRLLDMR